MEVTGPIFSSSIHLSSLISFSESLNSISNSKEYTYLNSQALEEIKYKTINEATKFRDESKGHTL